MLLRLLVISLSMQLVHAGNPNLDCQNQKNMLAIDQCWQTANQKIDAKMLAIWTRIQALPKDKATFDQQKVAESQNIWIKFRQINCSKYTQGSIAGLMNAKCYYATTKTRIHELKHLCKGLGDTPIC